MAISYNGISKSRIKNIIKSEEILDFVNEMKERLSIEDIQYDVKIEDIDSTNDGFPDPNVNAKTSFNNEFTKINNITFYCKGIENGINQKFSKLSIDKLTFNKSVVIYIKFMYLHELIHIQQFKKNKLTKENNQKEKQIPYTDRQLEIEANNMAERIIGMNGKFEKKIVECINSKLVITNENVMSIIELSRN